MNDLLATPLPYIVESELELKLELKSKYLVGVESELELN